MDAEGAIASPDFCRSVNPISTRANRLCPPNHYWHPRIFRPSNGPMQSLVLGQSIEKLSFDVLKVEDSQNRKLVKMSLRDITISKTLGNFKE